MRKQRIVLEDQPDAAILRLDEVLGRRDVPALQQHPALARPLDPGRQPQQRRLAAAGLAEQRDDLAGLDRERHIVQRRDLAEALGHALEAERHRDRGAGRAAPPPTQPPRYAFAAPTMLRPCSGPVILARRAPDPSSACAALMMDPGLRGCATCRMTAPCAAVRRRLSSSGVNRSPSGSSSARRSGSSSGTGTRDVPRQPPLDEAGALQLLQPGQVVDAVEPEMVEEARRRAEGHRPPGRAPAARAAAPSRPRAGCRACRAPWRRRGSPRSRPASPAGGRR